MKFTYNCFNHFKRDLLIQFPDERSQHFLIVFEPNKPPVFGNTEEQYYAIFGNDDPTYDMSIRYPSGTYFFSGVDSRFPYAMKVVCGEWRALKKLKELPPQIKATLSLLNISFQRSDEND